MLKKYLDGSFKTSKKSYSENIENVFLVSLEISQDITSHQVSEFPLLKIKCYVLQSYNGINNHESE